jgi:hypothetical protein
MEPAKTMPPRSLKPLLRGGRSQLTQAGGKSLIANIGHEVKIIQPGSVLHLISSRGRRIKESLEDREQKDGIGELYARSSINTLTFKYQRNRASP